MRAELDRCSRGDRAGSGIAGSFWSPDERDNVYLGCRMSPLKAKTKWSKPDDILLTVVAAKCAELLAKLEHDVRAVGYADCLWTCKRDVPAGTRAAMLSQGAGVHGICAFGVCINANRVPTVFDGRASTEKMFHFSRFVDPNRSVLIDDAQTRAVLGEQIGQRSSGCKLPPGDYERLLRLAPPA
jgi:hypothetical protein